ncbi:MULTISPECIES: LPP20 family lipoprotein [Bacteroidales]|uniref:LPP20 family lipoprotein n=1 Tax=Bacteroidales TaxID=171549 RepID=UPI0007A8A8D8|nr:LPP20 family lipoprotein [Alistipes sp. CHKCI003]CVI71704.1 hypothetical protein BN3659_02277 [Alistipes sp. CHKCI003]
MKYLRIFLLFLILSDCAVGQNLSSKIAKIKADPAYKWGEGSGYTLEEADKEALENLVRSVSVSVSSSFSQQEAQMAVDDESLFSENIESRMKTYSFATLQNVGQIILSEENPAKIFRYISQSEIDKSFEARQDRALSFVNDANKALKSAQIGDAIKYYYWAMVLLNTIPNGAAVKSRFEDGSETLVYTWCHDRICRIIDDLTFEVSDMRQSPSYSTVVFDVRFRGIPVADLDFQYWMGQRYSPLYSVKDGRGTADFEHLSEGDRLKLKIEYQYAHIAKNLDAELRGCFETDVPAFPLGNIQKFVPVMIQKNEQEDKAVSGRKSKKKENSATIPETQDDLRISAYARNQEEEYEPVKFATPLDETPYREIMRRIEAAIGQRDYESVSPLFTPDGYDMFNKLVAYGKASIVAAPHYRFIQFGDEVVCRSIPMQFRFRNNKVFIEDVTFRFDKDGRIDSIAFTLPDSIEALLFDAGFRWNNHSRLLMMEFMENYQTAYSLKRLDYIESVFSDDALIIVGKALKTGAVGRMDTPLFNDPQVELTRYTKAEYIRRLRSSFASKEYINIGFEDIDIAKMTKGGEIYAIHIKQYYHSNNYADTGYLTLLVDMRDSAKPTIHIRVWNPKKDPNFTALKFLQHGATLLD